MEDLFDKEKEARILGRNVHGYNGVHEPRRRGVYARRKASGRFQIEGYPFHIEDDLRRRENQMRAFQLFREVIEVVGEEWGVGERARRFTMAELVAWLRVERGDLVKRMTDPSRWLGTQFSMWKGLNALGWSVGAVDQLEGRVVIWRIWRFGERHPEQRTPTPEIDGIYPGGEGEGGVRDA